MNSVEDVFNAFCRSLRQCSFGTKSYTRGKRKRKEVPARCATLRQWIHQANNAFADKEVKEGIEGVDATNKSL